MPDKQTDKQTASRIVVAGHICLDIIPTLHSQSLPEPGRLMRIGPATVSTGGAVANTGLALHRLGTPVRLMGKVGDDPLGQSILGLLRSQDPALAEGMIVAPGEATSYSIVISPPGVDRSFMHCPGANDTFTADDVRDDRLAGASLFHFGYPPIMREMYADGGFELRRLFQRAHDAGLATSLDMAQPDPESPAGQIDWKYLLGRVLPLVDVFLPSVEEILFMIDRPAFDRLTNGEDWAAVVDGARLRRVGQQLLDLGSAVVGIKLGDRGLYLCTSKDKKRVEAFCARLGLKTADWLGRELYSPCFDAREVVGTTGSGDCTIAGFLAALLRGVGPSEAATAATAVGACSVEAADATGGVPAWSAVSKRLSAGWRRTRSPEIKWGTDVTVERDPAGTFELRSQKR